jgi:calcium/calmodulin-dependent 3',5'-cyclic nucleotide phosphodiesterase
VWDIEDHFPFIYTMLSDFDLINRFKAEVPTLISFVNEIRAMYNKNSNPYHNYFHGFNVMHATYVLLASTPLAALFDPTEIFALLLAGLAHDVNHTGRTNTFEVNRKSKLATVYHDISVLEQHHASTAFFTMQ